MALAQKTLFLIAAIAFVAGSANTVLSETVIQKKTSYFQIRGSTAEDLDRELAYRGPVTKDTGSRHAGATKIKFGGEVTYAEKSGWCYVEKAKVTLDTHIILPQWKNRKGASKELRLIWDTLSRDIKRHEERHAEIARNAARSMEKAFLKLRPQKTCEEMQARVAKDSKDLIAKHDREQARFDRVEAANFDNRMIRLLRYRMQSQAK